MNKWPESRSHRQATADTNTHTYTNMLSTTQIDGDLIRQKRLSKFLVNCAKAGVPTPLPLDATQQDNSTFDTMLEVEAECEAIGIPSADRPQAIVRNLPLPPTPQTGDANCCWSYVFDEETRTPAIPKDDGTLDDYNYPGFAQALASIVDKPEESEEDYYSEEDY